MVKYSKYCSVQNDTNSANLLQDELMSRSIISIHLIQILMWLLRTAPALQKQMLKRENVVMIKSKLSFHLLRIKTFHVLNVLFLERSLQRAA